MALKKYRQTKNLVLVFLILILLISFSLKLFLLTGFSLLTFILFLSLVSSKNQKIFDEREVSLRQQATDFTFTIFLSTISLSTFLMLIPSYSGLPVFSRGEFLFLESLGVIFAYLTLFIIILYSVSYFFFSQKTGGKTDEE
jgi:uncharacterized membrane protein